ncbi:EFR1 family ferrodoxin [Metaclostridioides mangenotii]|uniref:EFR1 family ferrodoxin n=1 Tax=Metaclostridioides mangenotii TaxID=1540 RepID=UPI0004892066|nr:EFR1 family ferrodoxin [Clostridioides mangenotii]
MKILYFTGTGNNLHVAKVIGGELYSIPKLIKENKYEFEDDKIGIIFPVYTLGLPKIVEEFLNKAKLESKYIFAIATYGTTPGNSDKQLLKIAKKNNFEFSYINSVCMVDNYLPMFDIEKEIAKKSNEDIDKNINSIVKDIESNKIFINSNANIALRIIGSLISNDYSKLTDKFIIDSNKCIECGICENVCPVNNVKIIDKSAKYNGECQGCLACVNHCPKYAIKLKKEKGTARFINPNITLKEIIESNN